MSTFQSLTINKDGFAFDLVTGENFQLNRCGQLVLQRLRHGDSQEEIVLFLCGRFGIAQNTASQDMADFYQQLNALGLLAEENQ